MSDLPIDKVINNSGLTELHLGAYYQEIDWIRNCVEAGFSINKTDYNNYTPLIWAIDMSCTSEIGVAEKIIDYLLDKGADIDILPTGYVSILEFAKDRNQEIFNYLEYRLKNKKPEN